MASQNLIEVLRAPFPLKERTVQLLQLLREFAESDPQMGFGAWQTRVDVDAEQASYGQWVMLMRANKVSAEVSQYTNTHPHGNRILEPAVTIYLEENDEHSWTLSFVWDEDSKVYFELDGLGEQFYLEQFLATVKRHPAIQLMRFLDERLGRALTAAIEQSTSTRYGETVRQQLLELLE
jgi:hypothetical protein